jgi:hypothetical protein
MERKIKFLGETNDYTFHEDIRHNSTGIIKSDIEIDGIKMFKIEFENGLLAIIDKDDVIFISSQGH